MAILEIVTRIFWLLAYTIVVGAGFYWLVHHEWQLAILCLLTTEVMDINIRHKDQVAANKGIC